MPFLERAFRIVEALGAREAFITSATNTVMPVVRIEGKIGDGNRDPSRGFARNFTSLPHFDA
jgi:D-alanine transaminase